VHRPTLNKLHVHYNIKYQYSAHVMLDSRRYLVKACAYSHAISVLTLMALVTSVVTMDVLLGVIRV